ncbi:hypothetical protein KSS87_005561 [Heliosperma pusillum]|nr:hypothetical protein KSS87_005561 [Heliosperma pusillum]
MEFPRVYGDSSLPSSSSELTSSIAKIDTVDGSHEFRINGYSLSKGIGIGKYIASDTFMVGGYLWAIYFYPDGKSPEDNANYVSLFIALANEGTDVRALFELKLEDQSGKNNHKVHSHFGRPLETGPYTLKYRGSMWGYERFFRRTSLETSDYLQDDCLALLHFIYWDELPEMYELTGWNSKGASTLMAQHMLAAADRYGLERLKLLCEFKLGEDIAINTVATTLALAEQHHCEQLKSNCLKFIALRENLRDHCPKVVYAPCTTHGLSAVDPQDYTTAANFVKYWCEKEEKDISQIKGGQARTAGALPKPKAQSPKPKAQSPQPAVACARARARVVG